MINITEDTYRSLADDLRDCIGERSYYTDTLIVNAEKWSGIFKIAVIIYRSTERYPEGDCEIISDLVPVWWEFHTYDADDEVLNDFQFSRLKQYLT